jgi:hypothetical protein
MMPRLSLASLKDGRWYEYLIRFALGGLATMFTGAIGAIWGPSVGGLFLALPAILCASATLIEKHEIRRKREAGLEGARRGRQAAALDAAGAALGSFGMMAFAICFALLVHSDAVLAFGAALAVWAAVALAAWGCWRFMRHRLRARHLRPAPARARKPPRG